MINGVILQITLILRGGEQATTAVPTEGLAQCMAQAQFLLASSRLDEMALHGVKVLSVACNILLGVPA